MDTNGSEVAAQNRNINYQDNHAQELPLQVKQCQQMRNRQK